MSRKSLPLFAVLALLCLSGAGSQVWFHVPPALPSARAQPPKAKDDPKPGLAPRLTGPTERVDPYTLVSVGVDNAAVTAGIAWRVSPALTDKQRRQDRATILFTGPPGTYTFEATVIDWDAKQLYQLGPLAVQIGDPTPPVPPVPPVPPGPTPGPAPIPADGLRVMILFDAKANDKLTQGQYDALFGQAVRDSLNAKCAIGPDGKTKEWRIWPATASPAGEAKLWQDAFARPHAQLPWLLISNGKAGFEGPLPANLADTQALIQKYGG